MRHLRHQPAIEAPKMAWEAEILSTFDGLQSFKENWLFYGDDRHARSWVEYYVHALIGQEIPRDKLVGYIRHGVVEKHGDRERLRLTSIRTSIRYSANDAGALVWDDKVPSAEVVPEAQPV